MRGPAAPGHDDAGLRELGYTQQLLRAMGGFHNFALSFSIISVLTGAVTLYGHGLINGGPLVMLLGWPLVTLLTLPVAASLAQLASSYPTAGALYHWSTLLGGRGLGFATAWLNVLGQFAITAGIDGVDQPGRARLGGGGDRAVRDPAEPDRWRGLRGHAGSARGLLVPLDAAAVQGPAGNRRARLRRAPGRTRTAKTKVS